MHKGIELDKRKILGFVFVGFESSNPLYLMIRDSDSNLKFGGNS